MKNNLRRLLSLMLVTVMIIPLISATGLAISAESYSGTCGDNLTWSLDTATGVLYISGVGDIYDYSHEYYSGSYRTTAPWKYYISSIRSVVIGNFVTSIGDEAFRGCYFLISVSIPDSVTSIGRCAFRGCYSLTSVTIPDSVTSIAERAFSDCGALTNVTIPDSVTSIAERAFLDCGALTNVTIPDSVTSIGDEVFRGCYSLTSVSIPDSVTSIGGGAFHDCNALTSVIIPEFVTSIGKRAFCSCDSLTSVTIGSSVASVGAFAFDYCSSLTDVYYEGTEKEWSAIHIGRENGELLSANIHFLSDAYEDNIITFPEYFADVYVDFHEFTMDKELPCKAIIDADGLIGLSWDAFVKTLEKSANFDMINDEKQIYQAMLLELLTNQVNAVDYKSELMKSTTDMLNSLTDFVISKGEDVSEKLWGDSERTELLSALNSGNIMGRIGLTTDIYNYISDQCDDAQECLEKISMYVVAHQQGLQYIDALEIMISTSEHSKLTQALEDVVENLNISIESMLGNIMIGENNISSYDLLSDFLSETADYMFPGWSLGVNVTVWCTDLIFPTYMLSDQKFRIRALYNIEKASRGALDVAYVNYLNNSTEDNAGVLVSAYDMFIRVYEHEIKNLDVLAELIHKDGVLNKVSNFFSRNNYADYRYAIEWISSYNANLNILKDRKTTIYNKWGLSTGQLKALYLICVVDGKVIGNQTFYRNTGDQISLTVPPLDSYESNLFGYEGTYYDTACTIPYTGEPITLDSSQALCAKFNKKNLKVLEFKCPIDIEFLSGTGESVLKISNDEVVYNTLDLFVDINNSLKTVYLPEDVQCYVKVNATDNGKMNYSITEIKDSSVVKKINYYDIPLYTSQELTDSLTNDADNYTLNTINENGDSISVVPDEILSEDELQTIDVTVVGENGEVSKGAIVTKGDYYTVEAKPSENLIFKGWYVDGELVSTKESYRFQVVNDVTIVGKFIEIPVVTVENYNVTITCADQIKDLRYAPGEYTTTAEIKAAEGNVAISESLVKKYTVDGNFVYEMPKGGYYTVWVRMQDGTNYIMPLDVTKITPSVSTYGVRITLHNLYNVKDFYIAKGEYQTYREIKDNGYIVSVTGVKIGNRHEYTYTVYEPGVHTILVRYNDGTQALFHETLAVDEPVFITNGLQVTISNLPDVKTIRTAYGEWNTVKELKATSTLRNFSAKTAINGKDPYTIQYREDGVVTIIVEYNNGYKKVFHYEVTKKAPTVEQNGDTVTFGNLDGLLNLRYAMGEYTTSNQIKNAKGSKVLKAVNIVDGKIAVTPGKGTYTFCVQYDDESYNYYTITLE